MNDKKIGVVLARGRSLGAEIAAALSRTHRTEVLAALLVKELESPPITLKDLVASSKPLRRSAVLSDYHIPKFTRAHETKNQRKRRHRKDRGVRRKRRNRFLWLPRQVVVSGSERRWCGYDGLVHLTRAAMAETDSGRLVYMRATRCGHVVRGKRKDGSLADAWQRRLAAVDIDDSGASPASCFGCLGTLE